MFLIIKNMMLKVKERICRQAAVLVSSVSVFMIVALASNEIGGGDISTLTVFAETNSEVAEAIEQGFGENKEEAVKEEVIKAQPGSGIDKKPMTGEQASGEQITGEKALRERLLTEKAKEKMKSEKETEDKAEINSEKNSQEDLQEESKEAASQKKEAAVVPCSQEDYQILLRIVQAEAGICDDTGKVLVANVILNRVRNKEFPNTIKDVVYQKSQFSPVANGSINTCKVTPQTVDCVNRALSGEDYSQGALYFMNRNGARSGAADWFDGRLTFLFQHERHEFFK